MTGTAGLVIRFAPVVGLLLASPVVLGALSGERSVDDALLSLLVAVVAAAAGLHLLGLAARPVPPEDVDPDDEASPSTPGSGPASP